jgi:hypothetical protein
VNLPRRRGRPAKPKSEIATTERSRGRPILTANAPTTGRAVKVAAYRQLALVTAMLQLILTRKQGEAPRAYYPRGWQRENVRHAARIVAKFYRDIGVTVTANSVLAAYARGTVDKECKTALAAEPRYDGVDTGLPMDFYHAARLLNIRGPTTTGLDILEWHRAAKPTRALDALEIASAYIAAGRWISKKANS